MRSIEEILDRMRISDSVIYECYSKGFQELVEYPFINCNFPKRLWLNFVTIVGVESFSLLLNDINTNGRFQICQLSLRLCTRLFLCIHFGRLPKREIVSNMGPTCFSLL